MTMFTALSEQTTVRLIGWLAWFFIGAAVLSATHHSLLDLARSMDRDKAAKTMFVNTVGITGIAATLIFMWALGCLVWPWSLLRFLQRRGLRNEHIARDCPHRVLIKEREDKTRSIYKHGADCRPQPRKGTP